MQDTVTQPSVMANSPSSLTASAPQIQAETVQPSILVNTPEPMITQAQQGDWSLFNTITTIGVVSIVGGLIYIGRKLQILDTLQSTSEKIKMNMNVVCNYLIKNHDGFNSTELQTFSPFQLTPAGKDFISEIGFDVIFRDNKAEFFRFIDGEQPKLKYDVEISSIKSIAALYGKDFMKFLKVFFYNNPTRNIENTAPTLGVFVRDEYLKEHPEIKE